MNRKLHRHDLSTEKLFSGDLGRLNPCHLRFVYPADVVRQRSDFLIRLSPLLAPIYSKLMVKAETFYVPIDNVWENAGEFFSRGQDGTSTLTVPTKTVAQADYGLYLGPSSPMGLMGFKGNPATDNTFNALPMRVYNEIYNWWYRDRDLQVELAVQKTDGPDTATAYNHPFRNWNHDRFTTARLEPQRGDDVLIPGASSIDPNIVSNGSNIGLVDQNGNQSTMTFYTTPDRLITNPLTGLTNGEAMKFGTNPGLELDDPSIDQGTIRELEEAVAINRFRKRLQTADGSYPDYTLATFGIRAPDIELQKPVLLARSASPLQISEVLQTAANYDADDEQIGDPVGEMKGHVIGVARGHSYRYRIKRHGYIMTILSIVPKSMYVDAQSKDWFRETAEDYFDPDLDMIGEEAILNKEVRAAHASPTGTFGYQYRNYDDRSSLDSTGGEFDNTLDFWHMGRKFTTDPALNAVFQYCIPTDRIFALGSTQEHFRAKCMHEVKILRTMRRIPAKGIL